MENLILWSYSNQLKKKVLPSLKKNKKIKIISIFTNKNLESNISKIKILKKREDLSKEKANFVYISSINSNHFSSTKYCIENGKNVICEKPICLKINELKKLKKVSLREKKYFYEMDQYCYHPLFLKLQNIINKQVLGDILYVDCRFEIPLYDKKNFRFNKKLGGGAIYDCGYYPISILYTLFNSKKIKILNKKIKKGNEVDISGNAKIVNEKNIIFNLSWSLQSEYKNFINIYGSKGFLKTDFIFSKKISQDGKILIYKNKKLKKIKIKKANQINLAFKKFINLNKDDFETKYKKSFKILDTVQTMLK